MRRSSPAPLVLVAGPIAESASNREDGDLVRGRVPAGTPRHTVVVTSDADTVAMPLERTGRGSSCALAALPPISGRVR